MRHQRGRGSPALAVALVVAVGLAATGCGTASDGGAGSGGGDRPTVVVTTSVLGAVVSQLVGQSAEVRVLMPNGSDPHEFRPSAQDVAGLAAADLIVENGAGLESSLDDALEAARSDGVPVFSGAQYVDLRRFEDGEAAEADAGAGAVDPHFWLDPLSTRQMVDPLAETLRTELGLDRSAEATSLQSDLDALDARVRQVLSDIPVDRRLLVTGHESMGYFARRYDFELVGALIPSLSSQAAPSAGELAALKAQVEALGVPAIFNELGTPAALSEAIAEETGARVVTVATHTLPEDGSYRTFMLDLAELVHQGLAP